MDLGSRTHVKGIKPKVQLVTISQNAHNEPFGPRTALWADDFTGYLNHMHRLFIYTKHAKEPLKLFELKLCARNKGTFGLYVHVMHMPILVAASISS
jgi:hypothetical protein